MFTARVDDEIELRLLELQHAEAMHRLTEANRAYLRRWLPWAETETTLQQTEAFIRRSLQQFAEGNGFQAGIWYRQELAGAIGLHYVDRRNRRTEIGYWLAEPLQGRGIVTRACRALIDYAFGPLGLHRVEIRCAAGNLRSRAIPRRLGFREEGVLRQWIWVDGRFHDMVIYGLLASEWKGQPDSAGPSAASL